MTPTEAAAQLLILVAQGVGPTLTTDELALLLSRSSVQDSVGRLPGDAGWDPTYNLNRGAALGWRLKAGKVSTAYNVTADGRSLSRSQMYDHCLMQAKLFAGNSIGTLTLRGQSAVKYPRDIEVPGND